MTEDQSKKTLEEVEEKKEETGIKYNEGQKDTKEAPPGVVENGEDSVSTHIPPNGDK